MNDNTVGFDFPNISNVLFYIGDIPVKWYALAYIFSHILINYYCSFLSKKNYLWPNNKCPFEPFFIDDLLIYSTLSIFIGGRLGYVLLYDLPFYVENPSVIFMVWNGGMSFHGALIGILLTCIFLCWKYNIHLLSIFDLISINIPIGLFLGRIGNFINGELWGCVTNVPWGVRFPRGGIDSDGYYLLRHPTQLYEATLEGLLLFIIFVIGIFKFKLLKKTGLATAFFACGYALARITVEFYREPDVQIGYLWGGWLTMGMILTFPMLIAGLTIFYYTINRKELK